MKQPIRAGIRAAAFIFAASAMLTTSSWGATLYGGTTTVTFDPGFISTVVGAGFSVSPVAPGTANLSSMPATAAFPITGGDSTTMIDHSGGLTFTKGSTSATIENFIINLTGMPVLTGEVIEGSTTLMNVPLFDISGSNNTLKIDSALGGALASGFGIPNLTNTTVGTAAVAGVTTPEPGTLALLGLGFAAGVTFLRRKLAA